MAHAPTAQAAAVRRRCGRRRGRARFRRGTGGGFRIRQGEGPEQADGGRPAGAQLPHLVGDLATVAKNRVVPKLLGSEPFETITWPTKLQRQALALLGVRL